MESGSNRELELELLLVAGPVDERSGEIGSEVTRDLELLIGGETGIGAGVVGEVE